MERSGIYNPRQRENINPISSTFINENKVIYYMKLSIEMIGNLEYIKIVSRNETAHLILPNFLYSLNIGSKVLV